MGVNDPLVEIIGGQMTRLNLCASAHGCKGPNAAVCFVCFFLYFNE